jgi:hypothetical protein
MDDLSNYVALDVEHLVVRDEKGKNVNYPTQVSIIDGNGNILFNKYIKIEGTPLVKPSARRVKFNKKHKIQRVPYSSVKDEIVNFLKDKTVIGHDLEHDFKSLGLNINDFKLIDTAKLPFYMKSKLSSQRLKNLTDVYLDRVIQQDLHNSLIDAKASMDLFLKFKEGDKYKFKYPHKNIIYAKKVLEEAKKYGLSPKNKELVQEKNTGPNLLEFSGPNNYSKELEELYKNMPKYERNLIDFPVVEEKSNTNLINFPKSKNYSNELAELYKKTSNNYMKELMELYKNDPKHRAKLINEHMRNINTRKINRSNYEKNLEGLFPIKTKWQILNDNINKIGENIKRIGKTRKARKNG